MERDVLKNIQAVQHGPAHLAKEAPSLQEGELTLAGRESPAEKRRQAGWQ